MNILINTQNIIKLFNNSLNIDIFNKIYMYTHAYVHKILFIDIIKYIYLQKFLHI